MLREKKLFGGIKMGNGDLRALFLNLKTRQGGWGSNKHLTNLGLPTFKSLCLFIIISWIYLNEKYFLLLSSFSLLNLWILDEGIV